jgi:predicted GIY-YIG superfamily endonuclease
MGELKKCTKCSKMLPEDDYYTVFNKKYNSTYTYKYCKKCHYSKLTKHIAKKWREDNKEEWKQLAATTGARWRSNLQGGVYLVITDKGLYVGQTAHLLLRLRQHKNKQDKAGVTYWHNCNFITSLVIKECDDKKERQRLEKFWIKILSPSLNKDYK